MEHYHINLKQCGHKSVNLYSRCFRGHNLHPRVPVCTCFQLFFFFFRPIKIFELFLIKEDNILFNNYLAKSRGISSDT